MGWFSPEHQPDDAAEWLQRGQSAEASGTPAALEHAVHCYDRALALLQPGISTTTRDLAITWMNRGNALQKQPSIESVREAVQAYDTAIDLLLPSVTTNAPDLGNSLGAAWLNRGHAFLQLPGADSQAEAVRSFVQAVAVFASLPIDSSLVCQLNLAGAQVNLAHALLDAPDEASRSQAQSAAARALGLTARHECERAGFAEIGLKARRVLCEIIARALVNPPNAADHDDLIALASEAVDSGMALARRWEALDVTIFRPLPTRLFRFGAAFYRRHQPHFLADFVHENLPSTLTSDGVSVETEWTQIAREALVAAREDLRTRYPVFAGDAATDRRLEALHDIESALARLPSPSATVPALSTL